jgi:Transglycosylase SLT domain/SPOR domain
LRGACVLSMMLLTAATVVFAQEAAPTQTAPVPRGGSPTYPRPDNEASIPLLPKAARDDDSQEALCLMVEAAAEANDLSLEFFARVIWQESRFQARAVGPVTRNGKRAQGIAQFMPGTASERGLLDPFDPVQALPKAAEFLNELRNQFGNLGLAAAAYNAGPRRVQNWLAGSGDIPQETRKYVLAITGASVEDWVTVGKNGKMSDSVSRASCRDLIAMLEREPNRFFTQLKQRVTQAIIKRWGVQVAAGFNRDQALNMYARAMKGLSAIAGFQDDPNFLPLLFRARGTSTFYQVRIGTDTRREANDLCMRIRHAGGACLVKRRGT